MVTGHPRSGTTMMMTALQAGGMKAVYNEARRFDGDGRYAPNPDGLVFEPTAMDVQRDDWWDGLDGKVVKLVVGFLPQFYNTDPVPTKVVFMRRDPEEIRQSYEAAWFPNQFRKALDAKKISKMVDTAVERLTERPLTEVESVDYTDAVCYPLTTFEHLKDLGWPIDKVRASKVPDPELYRFRLERLTVGI